MIKTAIVILNWNGLNYLRSFLGTVVMNSQSTEVAIYVADNASDDGSPEWVEENFKDVKVIRLNKNYGFAGGYNIALEQIDATYFVLLNSDIEVTTGWLQTLVSFMENNPDVASSQPKILSYHNRSYFEHAGAAGGFLDKYGYPFCRGRIFNYFEQDTGQYDSPADLFWSTGACMIVRSDAWKKCGGFDPDFFAHMEEIDLCWRFNKAGYRVSFNPLSKVYHVGGGALPYNSPFKTYLNFRNSLFLLYKNLPDSSLKKIIFIRKILDGMAAIMFLFNGSIRSVRSVWNAHIDYNKSISQLREKRKDVRKLDTGNSTPQILNKSIVLEFYIKGNKTFNSLKWKYKPK